MPLKISPGAVWSQPDFPKTCHVCWTRSSGTARRAPKRTRGRLSKITSLALTTQKSAVSLCCARGRPGRCRQAAQTTAGGTHVHSGAVGRISLCSPGKGNAIGQQIICCLLLFGIRGSERITTCQLSYLNTSLAHKQQQPWIRCWGVRHRQGWLSPGLARSWEIQTQNPGPTHTHTRTHHIGPCRCYLITKLLQAPFSAFRAELPRPTG